MADSKWYELKETENVISPSLLVYPDRIEKNIELMLAMAGENGTIRPHIKTHKTAEIIKMQMRHGIQKYKCATIAEAELLAQNGAQDILLAMQIVGANIGRFVDLMKRYPDSSFSALVDNQDTLSEIGEIAAKEKVVIALFMDLNVGMNRTGIAPNEKAAKLFEALSNHGFLKAKGLHVYDGHIRHSKLTERKTACDHAFEEVLALEKSIEDKGIKVETVIAGGSPSFPVHCERNEVETSPGTTLLWDARYAMLFPDMKFQLAAVLLMRVISKPAANIICLDLGHKMIACEMEFPRLHIFGLEDGKQIGQSEEHLVIETSKADELKVGQIFYGVPMHICPTVAKYKSLQTVENGKISGEWKVAARNQRLVV